LNQRDGEAGKGRKINHSRQGIKGLSSKQRKGKHQAGVQKGHPENLGIQKERQKERITYFFFFFFFLRKRLLKEEGTKGISKIYEVLPATS
jgi:hypothetical protein